MWAYGQGRCLQQVSLLSPNVINGLRLSYHLNLDTSNLHPWEISWTRAFLFLLSLTSLKSGVEKWGKKVQSDLSIDSHFGFQGGSLLSAEHRRGRHPGGQHQHVLQLGAHQTRLNWNIEGPPSPQLNYNCDTYILQCNVMWITKCAEIGFTPFRDLNFCWLTVMELLKFLSCYTGSSQGREDLASLPAPEGPFKVTQYEKILSFFILTGWISWCDDSWRTGDWVLFPASLSRSCPH